MPGSSPPDTGSLAADTAVEAAASDGVDASNPPPAASAAAASPTAPLPKIGGVDVAALELVRRLAGTPFARVKGAADAAVLDAVHDHHYAVTLHHRKRMRRDYGDHPELDRRRGRESGRESRRPARFSSLRRGGGGAGRPNYTDDGSDDDDDKFIHVGPEHQAVIPACGPMPEDLPLTEREHQQLGAALDQSESVYVHRRAWTVAEAGKISMELHRQPKESFLSVAKTHTAGMPPDHGVQCYYHYWKQNPQRR